MKEPDGKPADSSRDKALREHVLELLQGGNAHLDFDKSVAGLPAKQRGGKPAGQPHTPWRLVEHMRIAQRDILEFCRNPKHVSPKWPDGYWPPDDAPPDGQAWNRTLRSFHADLKAMEHLIADPAADLFAPIPGGQGQTLLREGLLVADHNAYHLGQLVIIRRMLGAWKD